MKNAIKKDKKREFAQRKMGAIRWAMAFQKKHVFDSKYDLQQWASK